VSQEIYYLHLDAPPQAQPPCRRVGDLLQKAVAVEGTGTSTTVAWSGTPAWASTSPTAAARTSPNALAERAPPTLLCRVISRRATPSNAQVATTRLLRRLSAKCLGALVTNSCQHRPHGEAPGVRQPAQRTGTTRSMAAEIHGLMIDHVSTG